MHGHIILTWVDIVGIRQITKSSLSVVSRSESEVSNATPLNKSARLPVPTEMPEFCHVIRQQRVQPVMLGPPLFSRIYSLLVKIDGRISTMRARQTDINRLQSSETDSRPNFSFLFLPTNISLFLVFCYLFVQSVFLFSFFSAFIIAQRYRRVVTLTLRETIVSRMCASMGRVGLPTNFIHST